MSRFDGDGAGVRHVLVIAAVLAVAPRAAEPCSISLEPAAHVFQPASGDPPGHHPWIQLRHVAGTVRLTSVAGSCAKDTMCSGKAIAFDRSGNFLRPRAALASGTHLQVTAGKRLLADVTITSAPWAAVPAWGGVELGSAEILPGGPCSPKGPSIELVVLPTQANLDDAVLLVYLRTPDPKRPLAGLARVIGLGGIGGATVMLENELGETPWLRSLPKKLWVAFADGEGNVGPAIVLP